MFLATDSEPKQSLMTKFFKNLNGKPNWNFLFEKEEAERKKREEEAERKRIEEEERLMREWEEAERIKMEMRLARKQRTQARKEEERQRKEEASLRKTEGREIIPGLYLGSRLAAQNRDWLKANCIKYVLNVTSDTRNYYEGDEELDLIYLNIPVMDGIDENLYLHFTRTTEFLDHALKDFRTNTHPNFPTIKSLLEDPSPEEPSDSPMKRSHADEDLLFATWTNKRGGPAVLVHCREGLSRSPSIVIAFLLLKGIPLLESEGTKPMTLAEAHQLVLDMSFGILNINAGFQRQLMQLEYELRQENSVNFFDKTSRRINADLSCDEIKGKAESTTEMIQIAPPLPPIDTKDPLTDKTQESPHNEPTVGPSVMPMDPKESQESIQGQDEAKSTVKEDEVGELLSDEKQDNDHECTDPTVISASKDLHENEIHEELPVDVQEPKVVATTESSTRSEPTKRKRNDHEQKAKKVSSPAKKLKAGPLQKNTLFNYLQVSKV